MCSIENYFDNDSQFQNISKKIRYSYIYNMKGEISFSIGSITERLCNSALEQCYSTRALGLLGGADVSNMPTISDRLERNPHRRKICILINETF